jgi:hypothetical protein
VQLLSSERGHAGVAVPRLGYLTLHAEVVRSLCPLPNNLNDEVVVKKTRRTDALETFEEAFPESILLGKLAQSNQELRTRNVRTTEVLWTTLR